MVTEILLASIISFCSMAKSPDKCQVKVKACVEQRETYDEETAVKCYHKYQGLKVVWTTN